MHMCNIGIIKIKYNKLLYGIIKLNILKYISRIIMLQRVFRYYKTGISEFIYITYLIIIRNFY